MNKQTEICFWFMSLEIVVNISFALIGICWQLKRQWCSWCFVSPGSFIWCWWASSSSWNPFIQEHHQKTSHFRAFVCVSPCKVHIIIFKLSFHIIKFSVSLSLEELLHVFCYWKLYQKITVIQKSLMYSKLLMLHVYLI